jgi:hypothetical protein
MLVVVRVVVRGSAAKTHAGTSRFSNQTERPGCLPRWAGPATTRMATGTRPIAGATMLVREVLASLADPVRATHQAKGDVRNAAEGSGMLPERSQRWYYRAIDMSARTILEFKYE